jgi:hypothetical protein
VNLTSNDWSPELPPHIERWQRRSWLGRFILAPKPRRYIRRLMLRQLLGWPVPPAAPAVKADPQAGRRWLERWSQRPWLIRFATAPRWLRKGLLRALLCWVRQHIWETIQGVRADGSDDDMCTRCATWRSQVDTKAALAAARRLRGRSRT